MRAILIISSVLVLANARPDVSLGYKYDRQEDNYQGALPEPSNNHGSAGETLPNFVPVQAHSGPALPPVYPDEQQPDNFVPTGPSDVQLQGVPQFALTAPEQQVNIESLALTTGSEAAYRNSNDQQQQSLRSSYDALPLSGLPQQPQQQQKPQQTLSSFGSNFQQQSVSSSFSQDSQSDELPPIITKHFYVHAAPEEPEDLKPPTFVNIGRKQKNYKIIFIKAPTYGFNSRVIPIVQPNEEKTIVYVLSKKPSYNQDVSLPPAPVTEPSKPEVFFIRYKTDNEAQETQQKIQGAYESNAFIGNDEQQESAGAIENVISNLVESQSQSEEAPVQQQQQQFVSQVQSVSQNIAPPQQQSAPHEELSAPQEEQRAPQQEQSVPQQPEPQQQQQQQHAPQQQQQQEQAPQQHQQVPQQQQQAQLQNEVHEEYLPPK